MFNFPKKKDLKNYSFPNTEMSKDSLIRANDYYVKFISQRVEMSSDLDKNELIIDGYIMFHAMKEMLWNDCRIEEKREWSSVSKTLKGYITRVSDVDIKLKNFSNSYMTDIEMVIKW